jgi:hypothetical protein
MVQRRRSQQSLKVVLVALAAVRSYLVRKCANCNEIANAEAKVRHLESNAPLRGFRCCELNYCEVSSPSPHESAVGPLCMHAGKISAASDRPGPNLKQRVAMIDNSQRETLCARNYAGEGQAA